MDVNRVDLGPAKCGESKKTRQKIDFSEVLKTKQAGQSSCSSRLEPKQEQPLVSLGKVTRRNPNVSSLLIKHPEYKKDCWRILHSQANRNKPYTRIRPGTEIFLDPKTREVVWGKMRPAPEASSAMASSKQPPSPTEEKSPATEQAFSERLVGAVKPLYGKPYGEINCYELLVKGLTKLGVRYEGAGGLGRKLMVMAKEQGLPMNAYFNGEGLIEASGSPSIPRRFCKYGLRRDRQASCSKRSNRISRRARSCPFPSTARGHTGIVSRENDTWTLINSGEMDHTLNAKGLPKGVGEESLAAEVRDWFELARTRRESLRVTLGRLNEQQLLTYAEPSSEEPKKA